MIEKKIALLDTDFIFKTFISQSASDHLIDRILQLEDYQFFCHGHILTELSRHTPCAHQWLQDKIQSGEVCCYTDEEIILILRSVYGNSCCNVYANMLKTACDAFGKKHFTDYYSEIDSLDYARIDVPSFLLLLSQCDEKVGLHNSIGEIKTYVLLQMQNVMWGKEVYLFCSDDQKARAGITQFEGVCCLSVISAFLKLKEDIGLTKEDSKPYRDTWLSFCARAQQTTFKVWKQNRLERVSCAQVFEEIYADKFVILRNGYLMYKSEVPKEQ